MLQEQLQQAINNKTKPLGALGVLETIALQTGMIQGTLRPVIRHPYIVVFAGDHGIAATGLVNPYPQAVTAQMVLNFLHGGAAINVFTRQHNIELIVVDAGVNHDFTQLPDHLHFIHAKIAQGTHNYLEGLAMSREQANAAIAKGKEIVHQLATKGCNCIGFGEMGIGNTSSASLIMNALTGLSIEACTGRGTGASDEQLQTKIRTLETVAQKHHLKNYDKDAISLLSKVGGFEIAMMAGAYLQAAEEKMVILVDGFIATAALLIAKELNPVVLDHCIFAHHSGEQGHEKMLQHLKARPLLQLGMRLGEGTGAALAIPLVQSAVHFLCEMASFESAGVEKKSED
ncbi:MAG: nicotinate-nucleotide--dimethylbenzimidazole phosphoribosyltransferase [Sediminibacterium magnilacihabitans]|jgi:nicotinate-nucleotide--dimethylbenzimidazole phosphoribosyltransferase|nr:nicotinate-nucleotide--dimethylbenzimidazole phosphoribosyltransferase [Sediminibacterium magnilacihabitans]PQV61000.1 nicotinate-nucleotide-dimethylbenzimidazole phosphoribosyltransferase [Sediminibacterium magnilacihabitans]